MSAKKEPRADNQSEEEVVAVDPRRGPIPTEAPEDESGVDTRDLEAKKRKPTKPTNRDPEILPLPNSGLSPSFPAETRSELTNLPQIWVEARRHHRKHLRSRLKPNCTTVGYRLKRSPADFKQCPSIFFEIGSRTSRPPVPQYRSALR
jgi:hypothetical protein